MNLSWGADDVMRQRREGAVSDVLDGMSEVGAAAVWHVQVDDLRRWVDDARADSKNES